MWGAAAALWGTKPHKKDSMKWHLVNEDSFEYRDVEMGFWNDKKMVPVLHGQIVCANYNNDSEKYYKRDPEKPWMIYREYRNEWQDTRGPIVVKESVNLNGAGVCYYCKKARLRELGANEKVMG